ncbi:MAG: class II fructose-bisphosphate aldolase [Caldilineales bacterium]|nr:class II fructose-bisphosphate aldolase [Caldilineales bacterium]MCW5858369.1 class II fructose-bisphosphate aldolase [Caldilineales bacterium]
MTPSSLHRFLDDAAPALALTPAGERLPPALALRDRCRHEGIAIASLGPFYRALAAGRIAPLTIPAFNLRGLTYDLARALWRTALRCDAGPLIFELSPSESHAGDQDFAEFVALVCAAAVREGYRGPIFCQGDHLRTAAAGAADIESLCRAAITAGMWQIDIDAAANPAGNPAVTAAAVALVRSLAPAGADVMLGGEVGVIGGQNTTAADIGAFWHDFQAALPAGAPGLGKISVQTGTRHGGLVREDGSIEPMPLDVPLIAALSQVARHEFGLPGIVQHGASTLTLGQLAQLPGAGAVEVHLATALQNLLFDHPAFPSPLRQQMMAALAAEAAAEAEGGDYAHAGAAGLTPAQQFYHQRWRAWGMFKPELWNLPPPLRQTLAAGCEAWFEDVFRALGLAGRGEDMRALYPDNEGTMP